MGSINKQEKTQIMFNQKKMKNSIRAGAIAIATAMSGMGVASLSTSAQAVSIANDGLGEAMIFPFYTTRGSFATFFNITNTSPHTVFIKVRWNEGQNSRDARDFNVTLSPYDVWTVATTKTGSFLSGNTIATLGDANGDGVHDYNAQALTTDNSCTQPVLPLVRDGKGEIKVDASGQTRSFIPFTNAAYTGDDNDTGTQDHERTRDGYFTVFEMGLINHSSVEAGAGPYSNADVKKLAEKIIASAEHSNVRGNAGVPGADDDDKATNCNFIDGLFTTTAKLRTIQAATTEPMNVLKGRAVLINLKTGVAQGYDPVTLANFFSPSFVDGITNRTLLNQPSETKPNLDNAEPQIATYVSAAGAPVNIDHSGETPYAGANAVSELLARSSIINDYNLSGESQTDWIVTFPTKKFYVDADMNGPKGPNFALSAADLTDQVTFRPNYPFTNAEVFMDEDISVPKDGKGNREDSLGQSCLGIKMELWDREEFQADEVAIVSNFSPKPKVPGVDGFELCNEANVLSFGNSDIFDSKQGKLRASLFEGNVGGLPGMNGWGKLTFDVADAASGTYVGIPVVGMRLESRANSKFNANSRYGFSSDHAYIRVQN